MYSIPRRSTGHRPRHSGISGRDAKTCNDGRCVVRIEARGLDFRLAPDEQKHRDQRESSRVEGHSASQGRTPGSTSKKNATTYIGLTRRHARNRIVLLHVTRYGLISTVKPNTAITRQLTVLALIVATHTCLWLHNPVREPIFPARIGVVAERLKAPVC